MTLGVTFEKQIKVNTNNKRVSTYRFYIVTENSEQKAKQTAQEASIEIGQQTEQKDIHCLTLASYIHILED